MHRFELDLQANRIEAILSVHRAPVRVTGGTVTPRLVRYHLALAPGVRLRQLTALGEELSLALGAPVCRIARQQGIVSLEVPRSDPAPVSLLPLCRRLPQVPACAALLGLDEQGTPLLLSLPSPDVAHVLVAGATGSGKTALLRTIVASLAAYNRARQIQLLLIDPKGRGFAPFARLPHLLCPVVSDAGEVTTRLQWLVSEMGRRDCESLVAPRLVLVIDELAEAIALGGAEVIEALTRLTQRGREAGVHVIAATQKPSAALLGPLMKANLPVRLVGRVASADDARVAAGLPGTQAERLSGRGDFCLVHRGEVSRFQAAYASPEELASLVARIREGGSLR